MAKLSLADCINTHCPWSGEPVTEEGLTRYRGQVVGFCNPGCRKKWEKAAQMFDEAVSSAK